MLLIGGKEEGEEGPCFIMGVQFVPPTEKKRTFSSSFDLVSSSFSFPVGWACLINSSTWQLHEWWLDQQTHQMQKRRVLKKKKEKIKTRQLGSFVSCWDCSVLEAALGNDCERALGNIFLLHWLVHQWYEAEVEQPSRELIYDSFAAILFLSYSSCRLSSHLLWSSHTYTRNTNLINIFV